MRIEAVRRIFPKCRFNEKKDEQRSVGLGPSHDWSSHAADAFGLMAISYEDPQRVARFNRKLVYPQIGIV